MAVSAPDPAPQVAQAKVSRDDWLHAAREILIRDGVGEVKIAVIGQTLGVSRSSFYWYFKDRQGLLDALLEDWEARNTQVILRRCAAPAGTVTEAVCHFFECFVDPGLFDPGLDFAVRAWARRDPEVRARIDLADGRRLKALNAMFARHGIDAGEADIRARILYFMQLGYHALDQREPLQVRLSRIEGYLRGFTGAYPSTSEVAAFTAFAQRALSKSARGRS